MSPIASAAAIAIASLETTARRSSRANSRGSEPCSASEYVSRVIPENDVVAAPTRISDARDADRDLERVDEHGRQRAVERRGDPDERRLEPLVAERRLAVRHRDTPRGRSRRSAPSRRRRARSRRRASAAASGRARSPPRRGWRPSRGPCRRASRAGARTRGRSSPGRSRSRGRRRASPARAGTRARAATSTPCTRRSSSATRARRGGAASAGRSARPRSRRSARSRRAASQGDSRSDGSPNAPAR